MNTRQTTKLPVVAIVAVAESSGAVLYGLFEVLSAFGAAWAEVMGESHNQAAFDVRIAAPSEVTIPALSCPRCCREWSPR